MKKGIYFKYCRKVVKIREVSGIDIGALHFENLSKYLRLYYIKTNFVSC